MVELQLIIVFHSRHFLRHLGISSRNYLKLLQLISGIISHYLVKSEVSILINGWVTANCSVLQPPFYPPYWNLKSDLCQTSTTDVRCHYTQFCEKNEVSILINGWLLRPNIVFHGNHFVRHLVICIPICVKLLQVMSGVNLSNLKEKRRLYLTPFSWGPQTRHTHTHTDTCTYTHMTMA